MPPFNWFNRKYNEPTQEPQPESTEPPLEESASETPDEADAATPSAPAINQDYLTWAKAAYQNIQKRQQVQTDGAQADASSTGSAPVDTPEVAATPDEHPQLEGVEADTPADTAPETEVELQAIEPTQTETTAATVAAEATEATDVIPAIEPSTSLDQASPEVEETPTSEPVEAATVSDEADASLPLWMRADAERQERLERLRAEAVAEPEPEADSADGATTTAAPDVSFDESFLWSAGILASQGRRPEEISVEEITWLKRLRQGLDKTRRGLVNQLRAIVGQGPLNQDAVMEIESLLLQADVGIEATDHIIESLQNKLRQEVLPPSEAIAYLKQILRDMLDRPFQDQYSPTFAPEKGTLNIWLMTGVNGAGKTTTIGKIAHLAKKSDYNCLIAAADTFRAAAVEQVKIWGRRSDVEVIANPGKNTDPAAVVFDAIAAAKSRDVELLLVDTAGRLQNKKNLMDELSKVRRIIDKKAPDAHIESLLVLDATLGQNGLRQAEVFSEAAQLSGVVLTKLDGTAKGGIALAVVQQLGLPIRFIGAGEGIEDLRPFSSYEFVEALLNG